MRYVGQEVAYTKDIDNEAKEKPAAFQLDMTRQQAVCMYSLGFQGPFGHWWYNFLEHTVAPKVPARYVVGAKVLCDQAVNALASNVIYFSFIPWFEGKDPEPFHATRQMSAVHGDGFHASDGLNLCKQLTVLLILGAVATVRARKRCSSSGLALVST